jgi:hypothetical protein
MIINPNNKIDFNKANNLPNNMKRGFNQTPEYIMNSIRKQKQIYNKNNKLFKTNSDNLDNKISNLNKLDRMNKGGSFNV